MKKVMLLLVCFLISMGLTVAQTVQIKGVVVDDKGDPVIGASVVAKGTTTGTITDAEGAFSLQVPSSAKMFVVSYLGMITREVSVSPNMRVALTPDEKMLDEVVVTALGIKKSDKALGYSATTLKGDRLTETRSSDIIGAMSGKVAGVQIGHTSTDPGASNSIIIRGISSLNGNNQPLFIVDGVPINNSSVSSSSSTTKNYSGDNEPLDSGFDFGNGANLVNPDDVESVTILKGSASTLYGSRAANGVVLITTKSGKKGNGIGIEYNGGIQFSNILRLPQFQNEFGMGWDGVPTLNENGSWGPRFDGKKRLWGTVYDNSQKWKPYVAMENNVKDFFETGFTYQNSLSFSGASQDDKTNYYASFSQFSDDGQLPTDADTYDKYSFSMRGSHKVKNLLVSSTINYAEQTNRFAPTGQGLTMVNSLYQTPRDISIVGLKDLNDPFNTVDYYYTPYGVTNPYYLLETVDNAFKQKKIYGKVQLDWDFYKNFKATYRLGLDTYDNENKMGSPRIEPSLGTPNYKQVFQPGKVLVFNSRGHELNHDAFITYANKFLNEKLDFTGTVGLNANERAFSSHSSSITGLDIPTYYNLSNSSSTPEALEFEQLRRLVGFYGDFQFGYGNFIYMSLTARNDYSSTLPKDNNSFFYPGATASFIFSEFLPSDIKKVVSFGKIRAAITQTGNDAAPYLLNPYYIKGQTYNEFGDIKFPIKGVNAYEVGNILENSLLSPEISTEYEFGLNFSLFNNRVTFDGAYYHKKSDKQIFDLEMDYATGFQSRNVNLGTISNKGIELLLGVKPVVLKDFSWDLTFNFTKNTSRVESLPEEMGGEIVIESFGSTSSSTQLVATVGKPVGVFKVTVPRKVDGKIVVNSETGLPEPSGEMGYVGNADHDYVMGLGNVFRYKDFTLGFDFDFRHGGLMYSRTKDILYFTGNAAQTQYNDRNPFIVPNSVNETAAGSNVFEENTTPISVAYMDNYFGAGADKLNEEFLIPRTYVKLRSISFGYTLPAKWAKSVFAQQIKLSAFASNLFVWTPVGNTFIDPEVSTFGNDLKGKMGEYSANPSSRKYGFNLLVKF